MHRIEKIGICIDTVNQIQEQVEDRTPRMSAETPLDYEERLRTKIAHVVSVYCAQWQAQATTDAGDTIAANQGR